MKFVVYDGYSGNYVQLRFDKDSYDPTGYLRNRNDLFNRKTATVEHVGIWETDPDMEQIRRAVWKEACEGCIYDHDGYEGCSGYDGCSKGYEFDLFPVEDA